MVHYAASGAKGGRDNQREDMVYHRPDDSSKIFGVRYVSNSFVIDAATRELVASGTPVRIEPKVLDLILHLIERRDRMVSKDELVATVWQGRFISDAAISSAVSAARRALGDDGHKQRYLRTIHGRGFRFVGALVEVGSGALQPAPAVGDDGALRQEIRSLSQRSTRTERNRGHAMTGRKTTVGFLA